MGYKVSIWLQALTVQGSLWEKIPFFCAFKEHFSPFSLSSSDAIFLPSDT